MIEVKRCLLKGVLGISFFHEIRLFIFELSKYLLSSSLSYFVVTKQTSHLWADLLLEGANKAIKTN